MDLKFDGLMLETHISPKEAWTDAKQQITAAELIEILQNLKIRNHQEIEEAEIIGFRSQLMELDDSIIQLLHERMKVSATIGNYKKEHNLAVLQSSQWEESLRKNVKKAMMAELSEEFSTTLFKLIHQESIHIQSTILNSVNQHEND
jgi:chorismate mutase